MEEAIDLAAQGVRLPTHGIWMDVPGSAFQVMTQDTEMAGMIHVRVRPAWSAYWKEFMSQREAGEDAHYIGEHWSDCENRNCVGCV